MMQNSGTAGGATTVGSTLLNRGPQPGWMTLNDARERAFTGEIVFEVEPEVRAYLDNGVVYYAERSTDASLAERLLATGLVDHDQLERGTVRVGEVEHLGRLFDREDSVDRDAVLVATELETEMIVAAIANDAYCTVRSTAYRHHPSGLHRWFATPVDGAVDRRFRDVSSPEPSVVNDVPALPLVPEHALVDQLYIEWDEPIIGGVRVDADEMLVDEFDDSLLQAMLDESVMQYDIIEFDEVAEIDRVAEIATVRIEYPEIEELEPASFDEPWFEDADVEPIGQPAGDIQPNGVIMPGGDEFLVMWPTGEVAAVVVTETESRDDGSISDDLVTEVEADVVHDDEVEEPQPDGELAMTPIETWDEEIVADVPAQVADAVKRAIAALERITQEHPVVAPILQPSEFEDVHAPVLPTAPTATSFAGFAPPTLDMSAEAIYARATAQMEAEAMAAVPFDQTSVIDADTPGDANPDAAQVTPEPAAPAGVASVVFVDDEVPVASGDDSNERSSALRRLIGSLRRKDR
jgi:hypothetical protein